MNFSHWYQKREQAYLKSSLMHVLQSIDEVKLQTDLVQLGASLLPFSKQTLLGKQQIITLSDSIFDVTNIVSSTELLPIQSKSIDFVLVMHSFETSNNAHALIREVNRILKDDGFVFVVALNKPSFVNIIANMSRLFSPKLDIKRNMPISKMDDWFMVLGFSKIKQQLLFNKKLLNEIFNGKLLKLNNYLFQCGVVYTCLYQKRVMPLTLNTEKWQQKRRLKPILAETRIQHKNINKHD